MAQLQTEGESAPYYPPSNSLANLLDMPDNNALESRVRIDHNKWWSGRVAPIGKRNQDGPVRWDVTYIAV